jgi:hypothetical protein
MWPDRLIRGVCQVNGVTSVPFVYLRPAPRRPSNVMSNALRAAFHRLEAHYNGRRPHRSRQLRPPRPDHPVADLSQKWIKRRPVLGGLISE